MSRYIEVENMRAIFSQSKSLTQAWNGFDMAPTIDIVRCKECKHYTETKGCLLEDNSTRQSDDFCSYGERKEGRVMETIPKDEVCRMICKHCIKVNKFCQHRWDCPLLTEIAKYKDEPSNSEKPNNCEYAENPSGDVWECGCFLDTYCEHQIYDRNPDGTINIVECGYEPKDEPQTDCPWK